MQIGSSIKLAGSSCLPCYPNMRYILTDPLPEGTFSTWITNGWAPKLRHQKDALKSGQKNYSSGKVPEGTFSTWLTIGWASKLRHQKDALKSGHKNYSSGKDIMRLENDNLLSA